MKIYSKYSEDEVNTLEDALNQGVFTFALGLSAFLWFFPKAIKIIALDFQTYDPSSFKFFVKAKHDDIVSLSQYLMVFYLISIQLGFFYAARPIGQQGGLTSTIKRT